MHQTQMAGYHLSAQGVFLFSNAVKNMRRVLPIANAPYGAFNAEDLDEIFQLGSDG